MAQMRSGGRSTIRPFKRSDCQIGQSLLAISIDCCSMHWLRMSDRVPINDRARFNISLTILVFPAGHSCIVIWSSAMRLISSPDLISSASRRRLPRWPAGSPLRDVERYLVSKTLVNNHANRTASARLFGVSVRTLRSKITDYSAEVPARCRGDHVSRR